MLTKVFEEGLAQTRRPDRASLPSPERRRARALARVLASPKATGHARNTEVGRLPERCPSVLGIGCPAAGSLKARARTKREKATVLAERRLFNCRILRGSQLWVNGWTHPSPTPGPLPRKLLLCNPWPRRGSRPRAPFLRVQRSRAARRRLGTFHGPNEAKASGYPGAQRGLSSRTQDSKPSRL